MTNISQNNQGFNPFFQRHSRRNKTAEDITSQATDITQSPDKIKQFHLLQTKRNLHDSFSRCQQSRATMNSELADLENQIAALAQDSEGSDDA